MILLTALILGATATASVNIRDPMSVFGDLEMKGNIELTEPAGTGPENENAIIMNTEPIYLDKFNQKPSIGTTTNGENLLLTGNANILGKVDMENSKIQNLQDPNNPQDAATKNYVDNNAGSGNGIGGGITIPPYNDISSQRQAGTTYTNNHNGPKAVTAITDSFNNNNQLEAYVNGKMVEAYGDDSGTGSEGFQTVSFLVPQNANYKVRTPANGGIIDKWYEQDLQGGDADTGSGSGGGDEAGSQDLEWENTRTVVDSGTGSAFVTCGPREILTDAYCQVQIGGGPFEGQAKMKSTACDTRNSNRAEISSDDRVNVMGTCVPENVYPNSQTDTVSISATGLDGGTGSDTQKLSLGRRYENIVEVEWTGRGIQPARNYGETYAEWSISLVDSETGAQNTIIQSGAIKGGFGADAIPPEYRADSVDQPVLRDRSTYISGFSQVAADTVKLSVDDSGNNDGYWSGDEEIDITYIPEN